MCSVFRGVLCLLTLAWAFGAIYFDGPLQRGSGNLTLAIIWTVITLALLVVIRGGWKRFAIWLTAMAIVVGPWLTIHPSNDRDWKPGWAEVGWAELDGDTVTFHNFRNFDYSVAGDVTERWETKTVHLSNLQGLDYFHVAFGGKLLAHPVFSFELGEDGRVALSIETRREKHEGFSALGGLYKMFELQYLFGDERDLIRMRASRGEPIFLYRTNFAKERVLESFLDSVETLNGLKERPRWYNVVTANCTTSVRAQTPVAKRSKFDYRMLVNGMLDELSYERGVFVTGGLPFAELKGMSLINEKAKAAHDLPDFSAAIRDGLPGS